MKVNGDTWGEWVRERFSIITIDLHWPLLLPLTLIDLILKSYLDLSRDPSPDLGLDPSPDLGLDPSPDLGLDPSPDLGLDPSPELGLASTCFVKCCGNNTIQDIHTIYGLNFNYVIFPFFKNVKKNIYVKSMKR